MQQPEERSEPMSDFIADEKVDPIFQQQVKRLYRLTVYGRWIFVGLLWVSVGSLSFWGLRSDITLLRQHFTWVGLRYAWMYNLWPRLGIAICVGITAAVLVWQSRNLLLGMPQEEQRRLEQQVFRIRHQGPSHPLWKWVCQLKND